MYSPKTSENHFKPPSWEIGNEIERSGIKRIFSD